MALVVARGFIPCGCSLICALQHAQGQPGNELVKASLGYQSRTTAMHLRIPMDTQISILTGKAEEQLPHGIARPSDR
jgi:hypothetical protein